jgi:hypothetical protein
MAQIAEDLLLLLLDNATAQPALDRRRRERLLAGAVLLDLAYACRIRPAVSGEPAGQGRLLALAGGGPVDPVAQPAFRLLERHPLRPETAVSKLRKGTQESVALHLEGLGQIRRVRLQSKRFSTPYAWPLVNRDRVGRARAELLSALFDRRPPTPTTAGIVSLLHAADGLGALLSLNERGWRWVHARASEIAGGSWVHEYPTALPEMNLAVTASTLRSALS